MRVICKYKRSDKTMMIVTHEMNFARAISNRVFYMDQGGIYEDGTPEQIFDHPQKELKRRFLKKLRILELSIDSRDYDFIGAGAEIDRYCLQKTTAVTAAYGGERFDPRETDNELSLVTLRSASEEINYRYDPECEQANRIKIRVRL